jgi:hypothetical protein
MKTSSLVKSYWHAAIAIETTFVGQYLLANTGKRWDWYTFAYSALGALVAPATRALVEKYPLLSPLAVILKAKIANKLGTKVAVNSNSAAPVTTVTTPPASTNSASGA